MSQAVDSQRTASVAPAEEFVAALAARDWQRLQSCLAPDLPFHAAVPGEGSFRERSGAEETVGLIAKWFGDSDPLELLHSQVEALADRVHISYRFAAFEEGRWHLVEQQAFARIEDGRIVKLDLVCSGFRPVDERPVR
ncbi:MAG: nuclear transport factor 2 family protein [Gaiellaceae bacterium]